MLKRNAFVTGFIQPRGMKRGGFLVAIRANKSGPTSVNKDSFFENRNMLYDAFLAMPMSLMQAPVTMWARTHCRYTSHMDVVMTLLIRCDLFDFDVIERQINRYFRVFLRQLSLCNACPLEFKVKLNCY